MTMTRKWGTMERKRERTLGGWRKNELEGQGRESEENNTDGDADCKGQGHYS